MNRTDPNNHHEGLLHDSNQTVDKTSDGKDMHEAAQMLDQVFPLHHGSHQDVASYLVYYDHLLAMFKNGTSSGLKTPRQLLDYTGHKTNPTSITLGCQDLSVEVELTSEGAQLCGNPFVH